MSIVDLEHEANARKRRHFRDTPGFELVDALAAATMLVGVAYVLVPL